MFHDQKGNSKSLNQLISCNKQSLPYWLNDFKIKEEEYQNYYAMVVGGFNILGGIISTVQQFLKITQLNEAHRVSGIAWDKFYRNVKIELAKHPSERMPPGQMLKMSKEEFDRLMETSPNIPDKIVAAFKNSFAFPNSFFCLIILPSLKYEKGIRCLFVVGLVFRALK